MLRSPLGTPAAHPPRIGRRPHPVGATPTVPFASLDKCCFRRIDKFGGDHKTYRRCLDRNKREIKICHYLQLQIDGFGFMVNANIYITGLTGG
ncbi:hypothetical protein [Desulforamulus hydrothermalis]|uniref:Uncharacterized protein n=1 Tax=Desulforamulus hydrothermalis Lam5 = DSM 18033 TaxID=1121428 RepID=K8E152_9FIRM|nr:hypothetical protein [Desulforamulus hydrothermalis]CCO09452.1 hypothetical protein DESHY_80119 [Desulforamulus hydrothermalis Lam5 = DSM 18033]